MTLSKIDRALYRAQQLSLFLPALAAQRLVRVVAGEPTPSISAGTLADVRRRYADLLSTDLANVDAALYPRDLLFQIPVAAYATALPLLAADLPRTVRRKRAGAYDEIPDVDPERFPPYYRRTFHWQTDGYFSARSARLYDVAVELLFLGTADVMRRQTIPPLTRFLRESGRFEGRVLDVGCGTGRLLRQIAVAHPRLRLSGVDISPAYVRAARDLLGDVPDVSLAAENAECLPYRDGHFDAVTCVFVLHELPRAVRRKVLREMKRVLSPGGLLVVEDSVQPADAPALAPTLRRFAKEFHEPFYDDYLDDDLGAALAAEGFRVDSVTVHYVSKVAAGRA